MMIYILTAILAGASIVIARNINSSLAEEIGIFQGTFYNFVTGLILSLIFLVLSNERMHISYERFQSVPTWAYLGGMAGVLVVGLSSYMIPKMSAFYMTLFIFIGQLFIGIIIDYFTLKVVSIGKIIGGILVLIGLIYNLNIDKKYESQSMSTE